VPAAGRARDAGMTGLQRAAWALLALAALVAAEITVLVWPRLFDSTPAGMGRLTGARCEAVPGAACKVTVLTISSGRLWLEASVPGADRVVLDFDLPSSGASPRALLLGATTTDLTGAVARSDGRSAWQPVETFETGGGSRRRVLRLGGARVGDRIRVVLTREPATGESATRLRVEEVGLFASEAGLSRDIRGFLLGFPDRRVYYGFLARACLGLAWLGAIAASFLPRDRASRVATAFTFFLTLAATSVQLWVAHNPYWHQARDLRVLLASGPVQEGVGANLNYGMYLGSRLLRGEGLTFGPGWVPWERMPGYGFFGALAGLVAGFKTDLFAIGLTSIKLHLLLFAAANAAFVAAAARVMRPGVAVVVAALVCFMPNQLANTQADSIMVSVFLLTAAALCRYLDRECRGAWPPLRYHMFVHLSFALWFLIRPEGVVGWAALSVILYRRALRYLLLPVALYLAIGLSWGAYKYQYTGEFSMTTNTVGDNAWIGLWQVPNKFRWQTADASYFEWAARVGVPPTSKRASDVALREVARFGATYPVYVTHLALYRFLDFVNVNVFNGTLSYPHVVYEALRGPAVFSLMAVVVLCLTLPHEARRTLFLGWPILFNLPLFLLFFSDGMRHIAPCTASLLVCAVPPLLEAGFYRQVGRRRLVAFGIAATLVAVWYLAQWANLALLASDKWRYWTPLLDPAPFAWYLR
jgi:hypothetical protein